MRSKLKHIDRSLERSPEEDNLDTARNQGRVHNEQKTSKARSSVSSPQTRGCFGVIIETSSMPHHIRHEQCQFFRLKLVKTNDRRCNDRQPGCPSNEIRQGEIAWIHNVRQGCRARSLSGGGSSVDASTRHWGTGSPFKKS